MAGNILTSTITLKHGLAGQGTAWQGKAWNTNTITLTDAHNQAWRGKARWGLAGHGEAGHGKAWNTTTQNGKR